MTGHPTSSSREIFGLFSRSVALLLVPLLLTGCLVSESEHQTVQDAKYSLEKAVKELEEKTKADQARIQALEKDLAEKKEELDQSKVLKVRLEMIEKEQQKIKEEFDAYRKKYRTDVRAKAVGEQHPTLVTNSGQTYTQVTIRSVVPDGVLILHETGGAKIPFPQLSPAWSERFDYTPVEAEAYASELASKNGRPQVAQAQVETPSQPSASVPPPALAATQPPATPADANAELTKKLASLRQELRDEITAVFAKMKSHRQEVYKEGDVHQKGTYIKLRSYNAALDRNMNGGGQKPGMTIDIKNDLNVEFPEKSACFDEPTLAITLDKARNLKDLINEIKRQLGQ